MYGIFDNTGEGYVDKLPKSVYLNKENELPEELDIRHLTKKFTEIEGADGTIVMESISGETISADYHLKGWIGIHGSLTPEIQKRNDSDFNKISYHPNAIRLYVRGKLAVDDLMTYINNTQAFSNYIEGEICFDVLDDDRFEDISTSNREGYKKDDVRVKKLLEIVGKAVSKLIQERAKIGSQINEEYRKYMENKQKEEEEKRRSEEEARAKAEAEAQAANEAKEEAEKKQQEAEAAVNRERKRNQYILSVSDVDNKNVLNSVHSIYNMSNRVKVNLDEINNLPELTNVGRKKLEKAVTSNQRILSMSKLIAKAGRVIDDNDAIKEVDLTAFIDEYASNVLSHIYDGDIQIECVGDTTSIYLMKIKPLSFIMILDNLIGNAIKANAKKMSIIVDDSQKEHYVVAFKDDGDGIHDSISDLNCLFDFGVTTTNGSGLGLYYAKKQMLGLKGQISIERNIDKGATVFLHWKK